MDVGKQSFVVMQTRDNCGFDSGTGCGVNGFEIYMLEVSQQDLLVQWVWGVRRVKNDF